MPETIRDLSEILTLLADNSSGDISAQDVRDFAASVALLASKYEQIDPAAPHPTSDDDAGKIIKINDAGGGSVTVNTGKQDVTAAYYASKGPLTLEAGTIASVDIRGGASPLPLVFPIYTLVRLHWIEGGAGVILSTELLKPSVVNETTTARTLSADDDGKIILCTNVGAITVTVPQDRAEGFTCTIMAGDGAGTITIDASGTMELDDEANAPATSNTYAVNARGTATVAVYDGATPTTRVFGGIA